MLPEKAGEALQTKERELQEARRDTQSWMQRGLKAIHINDELQAELISHKAQSAEWEQRYKDLERSHYHSDKNSSSAARAGTTQTLVVPPPFTIILA